MSNKYRFPASTIPGVWAIFENKGYPWNSKQIRGIVYHDPFVEGVYVAELRLDPLLNKTTHTLQALSIESLSTQIENTVTEWEARKKQ